MKVIIKEWGMHWKALDATIGAAEKIKRCQQKDLHVVREFQNYLKLITRIAMNDWNSISECFFRIRYATISLVTSIHSNFIQVLFISFTREKPRANTRTRVEILAQILRPLAYEVSYEGVNIIIIIIIIWYRLVPAGWGRRGVPESSYEGVNGG